MITIDQTQYGFMPCRDTVGAVFFALKLCEKYATKMKRLYWIFVDLEKAFDRVLRRLIIEFLRHKCIPELFIDAIMAAFMTIVRTSVIVDSELKDASDVTVRVHEGSILSLCDLSWLWVI